MSSTDSQPVGTTSSRLLSQLRQRDNVGWEQFVRVYHCWLYARLRTLQATPAEAADVIQEVFQAVLGKIESFQRQRKGSFRRWLRTIAYNELQDFRRRHSLRARGGTTANAQIQAVASPPAKEDTDDIDNAADDLQDLAGLVHSALEVIEGEIEPRSMKAFRLVVLDGRPAADVAAELGMTANAVYVIKSKVLRRLRELVGDQPPRVAT